jgi:hypothetical protein
LIKPGNGISNKHPTREKLMLNTDFGFKQEAFTVIPTALN